MKLAGHLKKTMEKLPDYSLTWDVDDFTDIILQIADKKDYYVKLAFVPMSQEQIEMFKVWELKDLKLIGNIIDLEVWKRQRKKRDFFIYMIKSFSKFMRLIETVFHLLTSNLTNLGIKRARY